MWSWPRPKPALLFGLASVRFGLLCAFVLAAGVTLFTWWPNATYKPIVHQESMSSTVSKDLEQIGLQTPKLEEQLDQIPIVVRSALALEGVGGEQSGAASVPPSEERTSNALANVPARSDSAALPAFDATSTYKTAAAPIASGQPDGPPTVPAISPNGGAVATEVPASTPSKMEDGPQQTPPKEGPPKKESYPSLSHSPIDPPRAEHQPISQDGDGAVATEVPTNAPSEMEDVRQQMPPKEEPPEEESYIDSAHPPTDPKRTEHQPPPGGPPTGQVCLQSFPLQCR